jgi:eukaryotic-like serine/threonine-protein kinase
MVETNDTYPTGYKAAGRYEVVRQLGAGGMGAVYEAFDTKVDRPVALKFLAKGLANDADLRRRFEREAKAAGRIDHDNVCGVFDWGFTDEGVPFLVMELLRGEPVEHLCRRLGRLTPERAVELMLQVLSALAAAHAQGIVHRDLKPDNIFLVRTSDGSERVKLLDFGIAKFIGSTQNSTRQGILLGTLQYMSPEQASGASRSIDHRTDLWAVGVILYEMLTGAAPFQRETMPESLAAIITDTPPPIADLDPSIPKHVSDAVARAMAKKIDDRFDSAVELAAALRGEVPVDVDEGLAEAHTASAAPMLPADYSPTLEPTMISSPNLTAMATMVTNPGRRSFGARNLVIVGVLALAVIGGGVGVALGVGDYGETAPPAARPASSEPLRHRPEPVSAPGPNAEPAPPAPSTHPVELHLIGLPDGARVTFAGAAVSDARIVGTAGQSGELVVEAPGRPALVEALVLSANGELDLSGRFPRSRTADAGPANVVQSSGTSRTASAKRTPTKTTGHRPTKTTVITDYSAE